MTESKTILLTGGSGFVGRNILEQLGSCYSIIAPQRAELDLLNAEEVADFFSRRHFDVIVHAAGAGVSRSQKNLSSVFRDNTEIFSNLVRSRDGYETLISLGSGAEYDKSRALVQVKEQSFGQAKPRDEYGRAKYFIAERIQEQSGMVDLRCFGVFGKYEDYTTRFISNSICRALAGLPIVITQNRIFDYVYINDLVRVIAFFIEHGAGEKFYNLGSGRPLDLMRLAQLVKTATGGRAEIRVKQPGLGPEYSGNNSLLMSELENFQFTSFEKAIGELAAWYQDNWDAVDQSRLNFDA